MKKSSFSLSLLILCCCVGPGFYGMQFESIEGTTINTSDLKGKKIVIAVVSANAAGLKMVKYLDSVQAANDSIRAIAIPTGDFSGSINAQDIKDLKKNISIIVTKPLKVKRANGAQQHPLFAWLTQSSENKHFNMDVEGEGQVFIVSSKGTLYGVLPKGTPWKYISKAINQPFNE